MFRSTQINQSRLIRSGRLTDERSATVSLYVVVDLTLAKGRGEIGLGDIVNLLDARSAKVDALDGLAIEDGVDDLTELVGGQGTSSGLDGGKGLGDAELVALRRTVDPIKHSAVCYATGTYSARQTPFLTVG